MMREERINEIRRRLAELELQPSRYAEEINSLRDELRELEGETTESPPRLRYRTHFELLAPSGATSEPEPRGFAPTLPQYEEYKEYQLTTPDEPQIIDDVRQSQLDELNKLLEENKGMSLSEAIKKAQTKSRSI